MMRWTVAVLALTVVGAALAQGSDDLLQQLNGVTDRWSTSLDEGDADAFAALHADDAFVRHATGATNGSAEELRGFAQAIAQEGLTFEADAVSAQMLGDGYATAHGTYSYASAEGDALGEGDFLGIYRRMDGEWKILRLFGASAPAPAPTEGE